MYQPYISPLMPTKDVLHVFGDTLHPEVSRRLEALENHNETAADIRKLHEKLQDLAAFLLFLSMVPALYLAGLIISGV